MSSEYEIRMKDKEANWYPLPEETAFFIVRTSGVTNEEDRLRGGEEVHLPNGFTIRKKTDSK